MAPTPPTDAELDTLIIARLASLGLDITQLPPGSTPDPTTGSPGQLTVLASLRSFMRSTVPALAAYVVPGPGGSLDPRLSQQGAPPLLYPSVTTAWTDR